MAFLRIRPRFIGKNNKASIACNDRLMAEKQVSKENKIEDDSTDWESESSGSAHELLSDIPLSFSSPSLPIQSNDAEGCTRRVRFIDEARGLTPRYIVTNVCYRPKTLPEEIPRLYYTSRDFNQFEKEDLIWRLEMEIVKIQESQGKVSGDDEARMEKCDEEERRREELIAKISRQYNLRVVQ